MENTSSFRKVLSKCLLLVLLSSIFLPVFAQDIEYLESQLQKSTGGEKAEVQLNLSQAYLSSDVNKSIQYASAALTIGNELKNRAIRANSNLLLAQAYFKKNQYSKAVIYGKEGSLLFKEYNPENYAASNELLGDIYLAENHYKKAIDHFLLAKEFYDETNDFSGLGYVASKIGSSYERLKNFKKAIDWHRLAYSNFKKSNNVNEMILSKSILGGVYSNYGDYSTAEKELEIAYKLAREKNLLDEFGELEERLAIVRKNGNLNEQNETQFEKDVNAQQQEEFSEAIKQKVKTLEEIEKLSEQKQLVELKIRVQQDEFEKKMLAEQLEKLKIKEDLKSEKLAKENLKLALNNEKLISDKKSAENRQLFITITLLMLVLVLILFALFLKNRSNRKLEQKNREIESQKEEIQVKQENINQSIVYAKRIQEAILPPHDNLKDCFTDAFVYLNPKDNVSGDFLWTYQTEEACLVCAADCTGHGVPGAFMSIIFNNLLDQAVKKEEILDPASILKRVEQLLFKKVQEHQKDLTSFKDGMDALIISIDKKRTKLTYCGAKNGFTLIRGGEIHSYKGVRRSIDISLSDRPSIYFESETIRIEPHDMIYLFSDGFPDQKGGENDTKFYRKTFNELLLSISTLKLEEQKNRIDKSFEKWKGLNDQIDDVLVVGLQA